jgi:hypothetical protein
MHGVRVELLEQQAKSIGVHWNCNSHANMEVYESVMQTTLEKLKIKA